ncbi:MAG TPA: DUF169 domain-containing protein [Thermoplasmata archaeon]|nr:DUF169 domain-containing protein [Thermoplasmata archaeon]HUJ77533.1 DUF169 domain-containing protein [Thermoplasmata archaeon]
MGTDELKAIAAQLSEDLELTGAPVQISYLDAPPAGVDENTRGAPSVCTFFAEGRTRTSYATQKAHEDCEIGAFVLGIPPEGPLGERVMGMVGLMQKEGYLAPGEEAKIPRNSVAPKFVAYGPLGTLPVPPTNVLLFAKPKSAMLAMEAAGGPVPMNGRPMCAIVPTLNQGAKVAVSIGCIGSRIFTQIGDEQMVIGIRGDHLSEFARTVRRIRQANRVIGDENARRKREFRPTA